MNARVDAPDDAGFIEGFQACAASPVFVLAPAQAREFSQLVVDAGSAEIVLPFPDFRLFVTEWSGVAVAISSDGDDGIVVRYLCPLHQDGDGWLYSGAVVRMAADDGRVLLTRNDKAMVGVPDDLSKDDQEAVATKALAAFTALVGMLYALDHREVRITDELAPINRQQRRAAARDGKAKPPTYVVRIPRYVTISGVGADLAAGRNRRKKRPHERRAHLRRDRTGAKTIRVRNARINADPSDACAFPIYNLAGLQIGGLE